MDETTQCGQMTNFEMISGLYLFTDEILGHFTCFPHEEKVVQLSSLDHAKHIHSSLHHGMCKTLSRDYKMDF